MKSLLSNKLLVINITLVIFFALLHFAQPMNADDYMFSIANAIVNHSVWDKAVYIYNTNTSRIVASILQFFFLNKTYLDYTLPLLNIINAVMLVIWLNLIYILIYGRGNLKTQKFLLIVGMYLLYEVFIVHDFGETFMWKTNSIQFWGAILLIYILINFYYDILKPSKLYQMVLYFIFGLALPLTYEIYMAFTFAVFIGSFIYVKLSKNFSLKSLFKINHLAFLLGMAMASYFIFTSPGNYIRLATSTQGILEPNMLGKLISTYSTLFVKYRYIILFVLVVVCLMWLYKNKNVMSNKLFAYLIFLIVLVNIDILSFYKVAYFMLILAGRVRIFIDLIIFIFLVKSFSMILSLKGYAYKPKLYFYVLLWGLIVIYFGLSYYKIYTLQNSREELILDLKNKGQQNIAIPNWCINKFLKLPLYFDDLVYPDAPYYKVVNKPMSIYYGVDSIAPNGKCVSN